MLKKLSIVYVIAALAVAMITTFMQVQPALFFIDLLTGDDNMFPIKASILITFLALLIPWLPVVLIIRSFSGKNKNFMPELSGKTGIIVSRESCLPEALYNNKILVNGEHKATVSNGKSTFAELTSGTYKVFVKGATNVSPAMEIELKNGEIKKLKTGYRNTNFKTIIYLENENL
jgi:hypothetical protein